MAKVVVTFEDRGDEGGIDVTLTAEPSLPKEQGTTDLNREALTLAQSVALAMVEIVMSEAQEVSIAHIEGTS